MTKKDLWHVVSRAVPIYFCFILLLIISVSVSVAAQEDKGQEEEKGETFTGNVVKVDGALHCQKPAPAHVIEVPDRPGHALMISKRQCTWTKPLVIAGAKTQTGVAVDFAEKMEGRLHIHGFETDSLDDGEKLTYKTMGQVIGEKGPADDKGRWSLMKGTGKFKGIRGGGTYSGKLDANDELNLVVEGVYLPDSMTGDANHNK